MWNDSQQIFDAAGNKIDYNKYDSDINSIRIRRLGKMGKKSRFLLLSLLSAAAGGGILIGNGIYKKAAIPQQHTDDDKDFSPEVTKGRMWVRNHQDHRDIYIDAIDHLRLHATYIPAQTETHRYALCIHGAYDNSESVGIYARHYYDKGLNVLLPDLRGFGKSEGKYVGYGVDDRFDMIEWIYWIIRRDPQARIILHGVSMGAATTLMVSGEHLPENVIAAISDSAYTSAEEEFADVYERSENRVLPTKMVVMLARFEILLRAGYDIRDARPVEAVKNAVIPILFMHGDSDKMVNPEMCQRLYDAAECPKEYCMFLGADHVACVTTEPEKYWNKIQHFLEKVQF